jgi:CHASE3 domain sensor protein
MGDFLEPYHTAAAQTEVAMLKLEELAPRAKIPMPRIRLLKQYVDEKLAEMKSTISTRQEMASATTFCGRSTLSIGKCTT